LVVAPADLNAIAEPRDVGAASIVCNDFRELKGTCKLRSSLNEFLQAWRE
jgi:hypothetical protein